MDHVYRSQWVGPQILGGPRSPVHWFIRLDEIFPTVSRLHCSPQPWRWEVRGKTPWNPHFLCGPVNPESHLDPPLIEFNEMYVTL